MTNHRGLRTTTGDPQLPTAVLLHGVGSTAQAFALLQDHVEGRLRTVTYTRAAALGRRGPCTMEPLLGELIAVLDRVGGDEVLAVGHSWGGALARALAARQPDRVRAVVLLDATHERLAGLRGATFRTLTAAARIAAHGSWGADRTEAVRELAGIPASLQELPWPSQPVLAVTGGRSDTARDRRTREDMRSTYVAVAGQRPGIQLVTLPEAGHRIPEEQPAATAALIHRFAVELTAQRSVS
jgi:pimeloyl-ACP methyl ester carboxylesterase